MGSDSSAFNRFLIGQTHCSRWRKSRRGFLYNMFMPHRGLRVLVMDDDFYARKWNTALVMRDPRSTVIGEAASPNELVKLLGKEDSVHTVIVDVEYSEEKTPLADLLIQIQRDYPTTSIVCLSQYSQPDHLQTALDSKVCAFLVKREVSMALVPAILNAHFNQGIAVTPTVSALIEQHHTHLLKTIHTIPIWKPNPRLTPQVMHSFWLRVFFGMRASLAAEEMGVETATVERYVNQAYSVLPDEWADDSYLFDVDLDSLSPEDQAFVWFTLPPRAE